MEAGGPRLASPAPTPALHPPPHKHIADKKVSRDWPSPALDHLQPATQKKSTDISETEAPNLRQTSKSVASPVTVKKHNLVAVWASNRRGMGDNGTMESSYPTRWQPPLTAHSTSARPGLIESRGLEGALGLPGLPGTSQNRLFSPWPLKPLLTCLFFTREILVGKSHYYLFTADTRYG